jgi:hypothetical protein
LPSDNGAAIWEAALTVSGFLLVGTFVWQFWVTRPHNLPPSCLVLKGQKGTAILLSILAASVAITMADHAGWLASLSAGANATLKGFLRGPTGFAIYVLATRWGERTLSTLHVAWLMFWFLTFCLADASTLFLVTAIAACLMLVLGFAIGRKVVPWAMIVTIVATLSLLHLGKGEMRTRYWGEDLSSRAEVKPWDYPALYAEWAKSSLAELASQRAGGEETHSILSRASTIYLLFQAQDLTPDEVPYLHGETYAIIPSALLPRILSPGKTSPHDSTSILNVRYGNQTWESAQVTSIGWGLLNEAFANFGFAGCFWLAVVLGTFYGLMTRWSIGLPTASVPAFVGIYTMSFALQTEMTASIFITAYAQGFVALLVVAWLFSERQSLRPAAIRSARRPRPAGRGQH